MFSCYSVLAKQLPRRLFVSCLYCVVLEAEKMTRYVVCIHCPDIGSEFVIRTLGASFITSMNEVFATEHHVCVTNDYTIARDTFRSLR